MEELVRYDPHLVVGILGGSAGHDLRRLQAAARGPEVRRPGRPLRPQDQQRREPARLRPVPAPDRRRRDRPGRGREGLSRRPRQARHHAAPVARRRPEAHRAVDELRRSTPAVVVPVPATASRCATSRTIDRTARLIAADAAASSAQRQLHRAPARARRHGDRQLLRLQDARRSPSLRPSPGTPSGHRQPSLERPARLRHDEPRRAPGLPSRAARTGALIRRLRCRSLMLIVGPRSVALDRCGVALRDDPAAASGAVETMPHAPTPVVPCSGMPCCHRCRSCRWHWPAGRPRSSPRASNTSRPTTPSTSTASRCATACGCSPPSTCPRTSRRRYPILLCRTPYSVQPYGVDEYKADLGPSPLFGKEGYIFVYQDVRGRWMSEGEFVNMRPHTPPRSGPQDIDESTDTYDTIDWLLKNVPNHNGKVGHVGHLVSRLLHGGRHDRRPPGAQGRLAAGARSPTGSSATTGTTTAPCSCRTPSTSSPSSAIRGPSRPRRSARPLRPRHARRLRLLPRAGPARQRRRAATSRATCRSGTR